MDTLVTISIRDVISHSLAMREGVELKNIESLAETNSKADADWQPPPPVTGKFIKLFNNSIIQRIEQRHLGENVFLQFAKSPDLVAFGLLSIAAMTLVSSIEIPIYYVYKGLRKSI